MCYYDNLLYYLLFCCLWITLIVASFQYSVLAGNKDTRSQHQRELLELQRVLKGTKERATFPTLTPW